MPTEKDESLYGGPRPWPPSPRPSYEDIVTGVSMVIVVITIVMVSWNVGVIMQRRADLDRQASLFHSAAQACAIYDRIEPQTAILRCVQTICQSANNGNYEDISICLNARTH